MVENIKEINRGGAGTSLRERLAAYNLLEYIIENSNYEKLVDIIYNYYNEEYNNDESDITGNEELEYLLSECSRLVLLGDKAPFNDIGLTAKNYSNTELINFIKFVNLINCKYNYQLRIDSVNALQLQRNILSQEELEKLIDQTNSKIIETNNRIDNIHFDTISIISIFVAVIFALYSGSNLTISIVEKIGLNNCSLLRVALVLGFIYSVFISLLISAMTWYHKKRKRNWIIILLNTLLFILVIISFLIK